MRAVLVMAVATLLLLPGARLPGRAEAADPVRIMLYGDSITQGSTGDWTWRYWLWRQLADDFVSFDLVGPHADLHGWPDGQPNDQAYADPDFDRDHAAQWAQLFTQPVDDLSSLVPTYAPDVVVALVGLNDVTNGRVAPAVVADRWRSEIADARAAHPGIDVVLVQPPQVWLSNVPEYDAQLRALATELDTPDERVVATGLAELRMGEDTWDPVHPVASGEQKIASVTAQALAGLGIGDGLGMTRVVANGPTTGAVLSGQPLDRAARLAWTSPPGVTGSWLERRDATAGEDWMRYPFSWPGGGQEFLADQLPAGHRVEFRVRPAKGWTISPVETSNVVTVVPGPIPPPAVARPAVAVDGSGRAVVSWRAVPDVTRYIVEGRTVPGDTWRELAALDAAATSFGWSGLRSAQWLEVRVRGDRDAVLGVPSPAAAVRVPRVGTVAWGSLRSPRRDVVRATGHTVPFATQYAVQRSTVASCRRAGAPLRHRGPRGAARDAAADPGHGGVGPLGRVPRRSTRRAVAGALRAGALTRVDRPRRRSLGCRS